MSLGIECKEQNGSKEPKKENPQKRINLYLIKSLIEKLL